MTIYSSFFLYFLSQQAIVFIIFMHPAFCLSVYALLCKDNHITDPFICQLQCGNSCSVSTNNHRCYHNIYILLLILLALSVLMTGLYLRAQEATDLWPKHIQLHIKWTLWIHKGMTLRSFTNYNPLDPWWETQNKNCLKIPSMIPVWWSLPDPGWCWNVWDDN